MSLDPACSSFPTPCWLLVRPPHLLLAFSDWFPQKNLIIYPAITMTDFFGFVSSSCCLLFVCLLFVVCCGSVIHRDLACRNVLVQSDLLHDIKISDYGMARFMQQSDYYRQSFERPLPLRWMAPESLEDQIWTTKSDVWLASLGVRV